MKKEFFVLAHNIRSLYNVGSIFRTADAFGVNKIFLTGYTGHPDLGEKHMRQISKTALGAEISVNWEYRGQAGRVIKNLKSKIECLSVVALENNVRSRPSYSLQNYLPKFPLVLVLGEETKGVPPAILGLCDEVVEIPMFGQKESLNVSVAFGVAAYTINRFRV